MSYHGEVICTKMMGKVNRSVSLPVPASTNNGVAPLDPLGALFRDRLHGGGFKEETWFVCPLSRSRHARRFWGQPMVTFT